jgi:alpha-glucosidase (family GH31 glycosyl hydrolase)
VKFISRRGVDWYNFWTNEKVRGGQMVAVSAPIEIILLFARAGSILPPGESVESTNEPQRIASLRVYPGLDADFFLYNDDGMTYNYDNGQFNLTHLLLVQRRAETFPVWCGTQCSVRQKLDRSDRKQNNRHFRTNATDAFIAGWRRWLI